VAPIRPRRGGRQRRDPRNGPPSAKHLDFFALFDIGEHGGEMVLDVSDVE
jgi:hypothetical protein